jgi:hypothetical protein
VLSSSSGAVLPNVTERTTIPGIRSVVSAAENPTSAAAGSASLRESRQSSSTVMASRSASQMRSAKTLSRWSGTTANAGAAATYVSGGCIASKL